MLDLGALQRAFANVFACDVVLTQDDPAIRFTDWSLLAQGMGQYLLSQSVGDAGAGRLVAISGSQGSGKSTLAGILCDYLQQQGCAAATVSLDDFYLSHAARQALAAEVHPLLATRGVPGTHDTGRLADILRQVRQHGASVKVELPVFDKAIDDQAGQRSVRAELLIVEGWCMGVVPQPDDALQLAVNDLELHEDTAGVWRTWVNTQIAAQYQDLWPLFDAWLYLRAPGFDQVHTWRTQQEQQLPATRRMSDAALRRFIAHYQRLTEWQWQTPPQRPALIAELDRTHTVADVRLLA
ncbi:MAG: hypothetical protein AAF993_01640 [Pseudomonadota bacterium]